MQENKNEKEIIQELMKRIEVLEQQTKQNQTKKSVWDQVKLEIKEDLKNFYWEEEWEYSKEVIKRNAEEQVTTALATLVRVSFKKSRVALLEEDEKDKAIELSHTILNAMNEIFKGGE